MRRMLCWLIVILALSVACPPSSAQQGGPEEPPVKLAVLIANRDYAADVGPLKNPHNDAEVVAAALRRQGFKVLSIVKNGRRTQILAAARLLARELAIAPQGSVGVFYYTGHGAAEKDTGVNYLIPIDALTPGTTEFWDQSVKLDDVIRLLDEARGAAKFVIFDACRSELQLQTKDTTKGLVPVSEQRGMFIAYATGPGKTALDSGAGSGPYAAALAAEIDRGGLDHLNLFQNVKERVLTATRGVQQPWESNGLGRRVYFAGLPATPVASDASPQRDPRVAAAEAEWLPLSESRDREALEAYALRHGGTVQAQLARERVASIDRDSQVNRSLADAERRARDAAQSSVAAEKRAQEAADQKAHAERLASDAERRASDSAAAKAEAERLAREALAQKAVAERLALDADRQRSEAERLAREAAARAQEVAARNADDIAWAKATAANTLASYQAYLADPSGREQRLEAQRRIASLQALSRRWTALQGARAVQQVRAFFEEARGTEFEPVAALKMRDLERQEGAAFAAAEATRRLAGYQKFLADWPEGALQEQAVARIAELEGIKSQWSTLKGSDDEQALDTFVSRHGWSEYGAEAAARLVALRRERKSPPDKRVVTLAAADVARLMSTGKLVMVESGASISFNPSAEPPYRKSLGKDFLKKQFKEEFTAEGAFEAEGMIEGRMTRLEGIAGVVKSKVDGSGSIFLMQMHGRERTAQEVDRRDRNYAAFQIVRDPYGHVCIGTTWHSMAAGGEGQKIVERCEIRR